MRLLWEQGFRLFRYRQRLARYIPVPLHPCYRHPVTGEIEDSGGEASYATGQGMVDGAVYPTGILELTDSGEYYLTIRMSLMDYTANHSFWVQNVGDSGWSTPALGVTGSGTDNNGPPVISAFRYQVRTA